MIRLEQCQVRGQRHEISSKEFNYARRALAFKSFSKFQKIHSLNGRISNGHCEKCAGEDALKTKLYQEKLR